MSDRYRAIAGFAIAITGQAFFTGCMSPAYAPPFTYQGAYAPGGRIYGAGGGIVTPSQVDQVRWLAWPQTYPDLVGLLGYPTHRTEQTDIYTIENSGKWLIIHYRDGLAQGFAVEEQN